MRRLKGPEDENRRLKKLVAEQALEIEAANAILQKSGAGLREEEGRKEADDHARPELISAVDRVALLWKLSRSANSARQALRANRKGPASAESRSQSGLQLVLVFGSFHIPRSLPEAHKPLAMTRTKRLLSRTTLSLPEVILWQRSQDSER